MLAKWKTALLVFSLALTMSTAVLAAGGIGVSDLSRPVSQIPPAPHLSPFQVLDGIPVTVSPFDDVLAPQVAPAEQRLERAATAVAAPDRPARPARSTVVAPAAAPRTQPAVAPAPRPAPSGGETPAPRPRPEEIPEKAANPSPEEPAAQPDAGPTEDDDERLRAAGADEGNSGNGNQGNGNQGNGNPRPQDHKHRASESRQAQSQGSEGNPGSPGSQGPTGGQGGSNAR